MRRILKEALAKERHYYTKQLCSLGVYSPSAAKKMTISDLKKEYHFFFNKTKRDL
ncbi:stress protein [Bacillus pumilus]|uniref:stress protein n=1 Tax=Bacillus pumilus TaxID=1408 RepID=UPI003B66DD28